MWAFSPFPGAAAWQCSDYYYWFLFIREHQSALGDDVFQASNTEDHLNRKVLEKFGDVREIGLLEWWIKRGRHLFCEPPYEGVSALTDQEVDHGVDPPLGQRSRSSKDPYIYLKIPVHQDFEKSIEHNSKAIEIEPAFGMAHNNLAVALYNADKKDEAKNHVQEALKLGYPVPKEFLDVLGLNG